MTKRMLIVEDDDNLSCGIKYIFEKEGYDVTNVDNIAAAKIILVNQEFDVILLDLGLPDGDGVDLCTHIRKKTSTPIVMLTARDLEVDEVRGLMTGADDYITKPFALSVLRLRVNAAYRRGCSKLFDLANIIQSGRFKVDTGLQRIYDDDIPIPLTATEYKVAKYFITNAGKVLSKAQIISAVWDEDEKYARESAILIHITRLRKKVELQPNNPKILQNVYGRGYIWNMT